MLHSFKTYNFLRKLEEAVESPALKSLKGSKDPSKLEKAYNDMIPFFKKIEGLLKKAIKGSVPKRKLGNIRVYTNIKPLESFKDKVLNRGKNPAEIGDLVRGAVLFDDQSDAEEFVKRLTRREGSKVVEVDRKTKAGKDPVYGYYGGIHIDMQFDGLTTELQVMTKRLWKFKAVAHKIYTATRSNKGGPDVSTQMQSQNVFKHGNKPSYKGGHRSRQYEGYIVEDNSLTDGCVIVEGISFAIEELEDFGNWKEVDIFA